jgi:hypothetical protein
MTTEGRLAHLEGRVVEHSQLFGLIEGRLTALDHKLDQKLTSFEQKVDQKLAALEQRIDQKLAVLEARFGEKLAALAQNVDRRFLTLEESIKELGRQIRALDEKYALEIGNLRRDMANQFRWTTGMFLTGFVAILAAILAR